ncbi:BamA/TamA family outer membrane protein [Sphingomonas sp. KR3-1]|uniref:BamA/TamA family outer membrane protein n=1 Tax=Sphingomonas sp. KR3-1 TaxID=3156611 RepID=UPI0032B43BC4
MGRHCIHACLTAPLALLATPPHAAAQDAPEAKATEAAQVAEAVEHPDTPAAEKKEKKRDMLIVPVPISNPSSGSGLAVGGIVFYNPRHEPQNWVSGGGILYTNRGTKGIGAFHNMTLGQDRFRLRAILAYTDGPLKYFGTGDTAGFAGTSVDLPNKNLSVQVQAQVRAFPHGYVGLRYKYSHYDAKDPEDPLPPGFVLPPAAELKSALSMLGPFLSYDTRDNQTLPAHGLFLSANWMFGARAFGDSFGHTKLQLTGNAYMPAGRNTTLAVRGVTCGVTGHVPFYDLCSFGAGIDLRGYEAGRYRDRVDWAVQGEVRHRFNRRFGAVAFAGLGGIAPSLGHILDKGDALPSIGAGVRYRPFRDNDVNLRLDVAMGLHGPGLYFGIAEAF